MEMLPSLEEIHQAAEVVYQTLSPTPQYSWPLLNQKLGVETWLKHENHLPVGAFKVRGGLTYFHALKQNQPNCPGIITATRGNHGQSVGLAAARFNFPVTVVVPHGNSREKNAAMKALGVRLIEHGDDFQASLEYSQQLAQEQNLHAIPPFHPWLLRGVSTYSWEMLRAVPDLDVVFIPIGMGSGICGMVAARKALKHNVKIVGVVSAQAPAYARSFAQRARIEAPVTTQLADGLACRSPSEDALNIIWKEIDYIVEVSDVAIESAMRDVFECTHNIAEGAGAASVAAAIKEKATLKGKKIGMVLSGGNIDREVYAQVLANQAAESA